MSAGRRRSVRRVVGAALLLAAAVGWTLMLRPTTLGGPASYVVVSGTSMEPGLRTGDLVIARRQESYLVGDVVAFRAGGGVVVHRIVGGDAHAGFLVRGDNRAEPDLWRPTGSTILGAAWLRIPSIGPIVGALRRPPIPALLAGVVTFATVLGASSSRRRSGAHPA